jgi:hypothetical protein
MNTRPMPLYWWILTCRVLLSIVNPQEHHVGNRYLRWESQELTMRVAGVAPGNGQSSPSNRPSENASLHPVICTSSGLLSFLLLPSRLTCFVQPSPTSTPLMQGIHKRTKVQAYQRSSYPVLSSLIIFTESAPQWTLKPCHCQLAAWRGLRLE